MVKKVDKKLFIELVEEFKDHLFRVAYSILGTRQEAEDCLSETILKAYQAFPKLKEVTYFNTWIMRILINECKDYLRKKQRFVEVEEMDVYSATKNDFDLEVQSIMGILPIEFRELVALKLVSGYTFSEIADLLKMSENQVKKRYYKALDILKERKEEFL